MRMPKGLEGMDSRTAAGDNICFAFNLGGCPDTAPGQKCGRGKHVCAFPRCGRAHPLPAHRR